MLLKGILHTEDSDKVPLIWNLARFFAICKNLISSLINFLIKRNFTGGRFDRPAKSNEACDKEGILPAEDFKSLIRKFGKAGDLWYVYNIK